MFLDDSRMGYSCLLLRLLRSKISGARYPPNLPIKENEGLTAGNNFYDRSNFRDILYKRRSTSTVPILKLNLMVVLVLHKPIN